jgi:protein involved in polysaccharide export with SLBB domain
MKFRISFPRKGILSMRIPIRNFIAATVISSSVFYCASPACSFAQNESSLYSISKSAPSQADKAADELVAFSAETIIGILRNEPGLMLEVKKMLVRKAFEQGRVLEAADLTDDALFQLVRDQQSIRILATHEIVDRSYIRAKPTQEEVDRENMLAARYGMQPTPPSGAGAATTKPPAGVSQEQMYWARRDGSLGGYVPPATSNNEVPQQNIPQQPPLQTAPTNNPSRQMNRASLNENEDQNLQAQDAFAMNSSANNMQRISPDQLGSLLNASSPASFAVPNNTANNNNASGSPTALAMGQSSFDPALAQPDYNMTAASAPPDFPPQSSSSARQDSRQRWNSPSAADLNQDRPLIRPEPNPYADVPSLYDLYEQVSTRSPVLQRFGFDIFRNGTGNTENLPMDIPVGPDYVLGPGDSLTIELWGAVSQRLQRVVDRQGQVSLPEVGTVQVAGRNLGDVQHMVQSVLRTQFRDVEADVSLGRIRTVRVYVVGDVVRPGAYDISSLSTALNALYVAGGPTTRGSLRHVHHYRGDKLLQDVDAYDLLLNGVHGEMENLASGDTILVPPIGSEVTVQGMVRRPDIYELGSEKNLAEVLQLAGGVLPSGTLRHVDVERVVAHEKRTMLQLDIPEASNESAVTQALENFQVQDGDQIRISPILPYADKTVYLDGHVFHPGKYPYRDGMKITDLIHSYTDLLPEPSQRHAEIIRLQAPDYRPEVIAFNLADAMAGKEQDATLQPFDTVRIFGRYNFEDSPLVTLSGAVREPGDHLTNGATHLKDAVYLAGGLTGDADLKNAQVYRHTQDGKLKVLSVDLAKALDGDEADNIILQPKDRIFIPRNQQKMDPATVQIEGDVTNPGRYPLGDGMTAAELVKLAGGFKRSADTNEVELTSYDDPSDKTNISKNRMIQIADAMAGNAEADVRLHDGDVLSVREQPGWDNRGAFITIKGEVVHPGSFGIHEGERLSSVLKRAGGFRQDAYVYGAILERKEVRDAEDKDRADLIARVQQEGVELKSLPETDPDQKIAKTAALLQWQAALEKLQSTPPPGRLVVHITGKIKDWENGPWDVRLRPQDVLVVPHIPDYVMVNGAVYNQTAVTYRSGKEAAWYLQQGGGPTNMADKKAIFVVRADGSVAGGKGGLFNGGALDAEVRPGDMVVVPEKALSGTSKWRQVLEASQLASAVGVAISLAGGF